MGVGSFVPTDRSIGAASVQEQGRLAPPAVVAETAASPPSRRLTRTGSGVITVAKQRDPPPKGMVGALKADRPWHVPHRVCRRRGAAPKAVTRVWFGKGKDQGRALSTVYSPVHLRAKRASGPGWAWRIEGNPPLVHTTQSCTAGVEPRPYDEMSLRNERRPYCRNKDEGGTNKRHVGSGNTRGLLHARRGRRLLPPSSPIVANDSRRGGRPEHYPNLPSLPTSDEVQRRRRRAPANASSKSRQDLRGLHPRHIH